MIAMLMPDVTAIIDDPEVGGGQPFKVRRVTTTRTLGRTVTTPRLYDATGNIQPQELSTQTSTSEDLLTESIVIYTTFHLIAGVNDGGPITEPDEILYGGNVYRVTRVSNWSDWGFTIAYATRVHDMQVDTQEEIQPENGEASG